MPHGALSAYECLNKTLGEFCNLSETYPIEDKPEITSLESVSMIRTGFDVSMSFRIPSKTKPSCPSASILTSRKYV